MNKRDIKLLFINPSSMPFGEQEAFLEKLSVLRVPSFSMPIGLMDISAYLRQKIEDIDIKILDMGKDLYKIYLDHKNIPAMNMRKFIKSELDTIDFQPDIAGISILFSTSHNTSKLIVEMVKSRWNDAIVVCGGNHATNYYRNLLMNSNIDYVVRGEGEISFTEFVQKVQHGYNDAIEALGVIGRHKLSSDGCDNQLSPMIENLDDLGTTAYDLMDIDCYRKTVGASLMFSRGCCFKCAFCASHTVHGRKIRHKSDEKIMSDFDILINKYRFDKIIIEDDLFPAEKDRFLIIADKLSKKYKSIQYFLPQGLSVKMLDEEIIDAMVKMGISEAGIAIESGSAYVQREIIKKNVSLSKARNILDYFRTKDFLVYVNFILGFPGETKEMMRETIDFINTLDVDWVYIFRALPLPGSEIYNKLTAQGIINPDNFDWDGLRLGRRIFDMSEISADELENVAYDTNISCNFFNNSNIKHGRYQKAIEVFNRIILEQYSFHVVGLYCRGLAYLRLNEQEKADTDFKSYIYWINNNAESKKLYERYGDKMPFLKKYINNEKNKIAERHSAYEL